MNFSKALKILKAGGRVRMSYWSKGVTVKAQYPAYNSEMTHPYLYGETSTVREPYIPTQSELFSSEWEEMKWIEEDL